MFIPPVQSPPTIAAPAPETVQALIDAAQMKQSFYAVGHGYDAQMWVDFYVMGGPLSARGARPAGLAAALMNVVKGPDGPFQVVEIGILTCSPAAFRPTFRIDFAATGRVMSTTGPVEDPATDGTFLSAPAVASMSAILCDGQQPGIRIDDQDLAHFRDVAARAQTPTSPGEPPPAIVEQALLDALQMKQSFYPIGHDDDGERTGDVYAFGGPLSAPGRRSGGRAAALINMTRSPDGPFQTIEIGQLACAPVAFTPSYRINFDATGKILPNTGPAAAPYAETLLADGPVARMASIFCDGQEPRDRIDGKDLADFRQRPQTPGSP